MASSGGAWRLLPKDLDTSGKSLKGAFFRKLYIISTLDGVCSGLSGGLHFPPFSTVQKYFWRWRDEGLLRAINNELVMNELVMEARELEGREASPSAGVIDNPSVKTTESGGVRGFDAGKKVAGKRGQEGQGPQAHIVVDTLGLLVGVVVHAADIQDRDQDRDGAPTILKSIFERWPWLRHVFADGGYAGPKLRGALQKIGKFTSASSRWRSSSARTAPKASKSCRVAGSFSGPSHGWADAEGWPRTSSDPSNPHRPGSSSQTSACSPDGSQGPENTALVPIQTLRH